MKEKVHGGWARVGVGGEARAPMGRLITARGSQGRVGAVEAHLFEGPSVKTPVSSVRPVVRYSGPSNVSASSTLARSSTLRGTVMTSPGRLLSRMRRSSPAARYSNIW